MRFRIPGNHQGPTHDLSLLIQRICKCVFATPRRPWRENYNEGLKSGDDIC